MLSAISRSPSHLLHEVILVDDASELPHLQEPLEKFAARLGKVRIIRSPTRTGLIRARLVGASIASVSERNPVFHEVFSDSMALVDYDVNDES